MFIDDLAGKEIDFEIIFKFLIFYCPKLIPLVLPLTVLLASIMTFGDLAENYEFAAIKSSGISLLRSMRSLMIFNVFLSIIVSLLCTYTQMINQLLTILFFLEYPRK